MHDKADGQVGGVVGEIGWGGGLKAVKVEMISVRDKVKALNRTKEKYVVSINESEGSRTMGLRGLSMEVVLVEKLELPIIPHPGPYKLQCLSEKGGMVVNKQMNVELTLGKYKDKILCDIVSMEATYILLGRIQVTHNGVTNKFSFVHKDKKVILKPLTPCEVIKDQLRIKKKEMKKERKLKKRKKLNCEKIKERKNKDNNDSILVSKKAINKVLLNKKKEHLLLLLTNMCLVLMTQFLDKGLVRESKTPYVVLVILVPKNDGTWHIHLISYLNDLLDELYGACVFSIIDLRSGYH
ncbi:hypothetical protein CR513_36845, partial [Mucuna pruriens]